MDILSLFPAWLLTHGAALIVVLPLMAGAAMAVIPRERMAWVITLIVTLICTLCAFALFMQVLDQGLVTYRMGGWEPPYGIEYVVDALSAPVLLLISAMALICLFYAWPSVQAEVEPKKRAPFYGAFLICAAGLLGMVVTGDAFNVFVFLEVSSISTYVLVAMGSSRDRRALRAAYNYLILGSIGATFFVIGIGFLYMETGTLNMADMARILDSLDGGSRVAQVGFAFIVIGLGLKLAMFPLHMWLPGAYAHAPSLITVFLASTATKAALYLLLRFAFTVFDLSFDYVVNILSNLVMIVAVIGMVFASLQAIFQTDVRRVLAFSSIAQVGYMLLGLSLVTVSGLTASYIHLINHAAIKGGLFLAVGAMWYRFGITRVSDFRGLSKTMPWTMSAFTISGLSLIGVPLTAGFVSKLQLATAAWERGYGWAVGVILLSSILALIYIGRILRVAYFETPHQINGVDVPKNEAPMMMLIPMWTLAILSIVIGINADWIVEAASRAAELLIPTQMIEGGL
jgi:multicomponent Na+:H+ antiporter subunit D